MTDLETDLRDRFARVQEPALVPDPHLVRTLRARDARRQRAVPAGLAAFSLAVAAGGAAVLLPGGGGSPQSSLAPEPTADPGGVRPLDAQQGAVQGLSPTAAEAPAGQATLASFKTWLLDRPELEAAGYVESIDDAAALRTTILWHGASPLQDEVEAEGRRRGISVSFRPWVARRSTLRAAAAAVELSLKQNPAYENFHLAYITLVDPNVPGLTIVGSFINVEPDQERAEAALLEGLRTVTSIPLTLDTNSSAVTAVLGPTQVGESGALP